MSRLVVTRTVDIEAPRHVVWAALTDPALLSQWFGEHAEIDLRPGGTATFHFEGYGDYLAIVEEVDEPNAVAYRWAQDANTEPTLTNSTVARFTLHDVPIGTRLTVREMGWETLHQSRDHIAADMEGNADGWTQELNELKDMLEKQDSP